MFALKFESGTTPDSSNYLYYEGDYNWIQSGDLYNNHEINETNKTITNRAIIENTALKMYTSPFLVIAMYGASIGNSAISNVDSYTNQACCVLKGTTSMLTKYLYYYIISTKEELINRSVGGGQPNISQEIIKAFPVIVPGIEQQSIVKFLDNKCAQIDSIITKKEKQLELIKEHKKSLIYEYVTGKKRVGGYGDGN